MIQKAFGNEDMFPERFNGLPFWPGAALARYRFFSGHYDACSLRVIPGQLKIITLLRDPRERILSTYRFWRAHSRDEAVRQNQSYVLSAIDNNLKDFLVEMQRTSPSDVDNMYTRAFGGWLPMPGDSVEKRKASLDTMGGGDSLVAKGKAFLAECAAVGVLERFEESAQALTRALDLPIDAAAQAPLMRTSDVAKAFQASDRVNQIEIDDACEAELDKLTRFDRQLYEYAGQLLTKATQQADNRSKGRRGWLGWRSWHGSALRRSRNHDA